MIHGNRAKSLKTHKERNDCSVRALAAACNVPYKTAYKTMTAIGRKKNGRVKCKQLLAAVLMLGKHFEEYQEFKGMTVRKLTDELPAGHWIIFVNGHFITIVDNKVIDWAEGRLFRAKAAFRVYS